MTYLANPGRSLALTQADLIMLKTVLILGSAVDALRARRFDPDAFQAIVAINNAWRVRDDWTHLVHAGDFPDDRKPVPGPSQISLSHEAYVPANNAFGGIIYAGGTMAFSTAYWALHALKPDILAFCGCDMIYERQNGKSHFYGTGSADPLRQDPTLQSLEAKSNRLMILAAEENCICVNMSILAKSRLTFPRVTPQDMMPVQPAFHLQTLSNLRRNCDAAVVSKAKQLESDSGQHVSSGDYWNHSSIINAHQLLTIDRQWLAAVTTPETTTAMETV